MNQADTITGFANERAAQEWIASAKNYPGTVFWVEQRGDKFVVVQGLPEEAPCASST